MNCKKGELAVIVRSRAGNLGKFVTCLRLATAADCKEQNVANDMIIWVIDRQLTILNGQVITLAPDDYLRPIRDPGDDAIDETLQRLPAPSAETA